MSDLNDLGFYPQAAVANNRIRFTGENQDEVLDFAGARSAVISEERLVFTAADGPLWLDRWDWLVRHEDGSLEVVDQHELFRRERDG